ncbi:MAG: family 43 glycosylhydrolase [Leptospirales bacterium]|nr:family 43 glycosylhydrolase [Leptospirales bacterium]
MTDSSPHGTLRIGIMCQGLTFPAWQSYAIERLLRTEGAKIALLIFDDGVFQENNEPESSAGRIRSRLRQAINERRLFSTIFSAIVSRLRLGWLFNRNFLWILYRKLGRRFSPQPCDERVDMREALQNVPSIRCKVRLIGKYSQHFTPADIETIKGHDVDLIIRFAFNILRGEILNTPRYGVWSFHHDDHLKYRGGPEGFWEIYRNDHRSGAMLQRLSEKLDDGTVLCKDEFKTIRHSYSQNRNQLLMKTARWPADVCFSILNGQKEFHGSARSDAPIFRLPGNGVMLLYFLRLYWNRLARLWHHLFGLSAVGPEKWAVGVLNGSFQELLPPANPSIHWITPPAHQFYADPFFVEFEHEFYIFFELFEYGKRGYLAYVKSSDLVNFSQPQLIIERPYHLSYPAIIRHGKGIYCTPEQYQSRSVMLYEAQSFPDKWKEVNVLIKDFAGVDPAVFMHNETWWMFVSNAENHDETNLYLYFAESLEGPWTAHPQNPVKTEFKKSRSAGNVFEFGGKLIRPSQNGTVTYGGSVILNEIVELTKTSYTERWFNDILPRETWEYSQGLHTISSDGWVTVFDAKYHLMERFVFFKEMTRRTIAIKNGVVRRIARLFRQ